MYCKKCGKEIPAGAGFCPSCGTPSSDGSLSGPIKSTKSSTGLETNVAGLLCYLVGWITGIIFLVIEKEDKTVRFHAVQSIAIFGSLTILEIIFRMIPVIGWVVTSLLGILGFIIWICLLIMTYQGKMVRIPVACNIADSFSK
jgi:uncharacterized membrane protein